MRPGRVREFFAVGRFISHKAQHTHSLVDEACFSDPKEMNFVAVRGSVTKLQRTHEFFDFVDELFLESVLYHCFPVMWRILEH